MAEFLVFLGRRGQNTVIWQAHENPLGVFSGDNAQDAMQQAAAYHSVMGAFFAVPGEFWGVTPQNVIKPFGSVDTIDDKIGKMIDVLEKRIALTEGEGGE